MGQEIEFSSASGHFRLPLNTSMYLRGSPWFLLGFPTDATECQHQVLKARNGFQVQVSVTQDLSSLLHLLPWGFSFPASLTLVWREDGWVLSDCNSWAIRSVYS